ncbi:Uncharacterised protein (plasmid) [Legionella adelaidensis]|uniref:Uncharacterized protein n=1 Tax=Legionella adelaidensis TaxID=45056 RepID=A0A0W0R4Z9_9GAMM|nr:hypothetical protein [Legionella adelaidensis]KTC66175.1 hypothetical protein Lade_0833 [Legionella adelaidensis]VEH85582.1 Uncharacterised protein [Legionella adelaidensis]
MKKSFFALTGSILLILCSPISAKNVNANDGNNVVKSITLKPSTPSSDKNFDIVVKLSNGETVTKTISEENIEQVKKGNEVKLSLDIFG